MVTTEQSIQVVRASGTPAERGGTIGAACQQKISISTELYARMFGMPEAELQQQGERYSNIIRDFAPDLASEIEACAEASGVAAYRLFAMNARSEILSTVGIPECTAIGLLPTSVLGQTWDWIDAFENLFVIVSHQFPNGRRILTVTEPGMLAKIGLNSDGIGVCLNFLNSSRPWSSGIPIHVFLRALLECSNWESVQRLIDSQSTGVIGNVLAMSATAGQVVNIEGAADGAVITVPQGEIFIHTNHYLNLGPQSDAMALAGNSIGRLEAAQCLSSSLKTFTVEDLKQILSDVDLGPISCPYTPYAGLQVGTVCAVAMDLRARALHVRKGPSPNGLFETHYI